MIPPIAIDPATPKVVLATAIPIFAAFIAYRNYTRKSGLRLRGSYSTRSSIECANSFVGSVTIENLKDRAVTVFAIYLRFGPNVYVLIEEFDEQPLILRPFETYQKEYDPIEFYTFNMRRFSFDNLLRDKTVKQRLVVSTSEGKYTVKQFLRRWDPVHVWFRNHMTTVLTPVRTLFKGKGYGSETLFLVELKLANNTEHVIPIHASDWQVRRFTQFRLTQESLQSKEALETLLIREKDAGNLLATAVTVHDITSFRKERFESYDLTPIEVERTGACRYYLLGWLATRLSNWAIRRENAKRSARPNEIASKNGGQSIGHRKDAAEKP